jgi:hypothetical protein
MTVDELILELLKIRDKSQKIAFFNIDALIDEQDLFSFNNALETKYDGEDVVLLKWED